MLHSRRTFLKILSSFFPLAGLPVRIRMGDAHGVEILECPVAGVQYHVTPEFVDRMSVGGPVRIVAEPSNPHDRNALRLDYRGVKIGYIPRRHNSEAAELAQTGRRLAGNVTLADSSAPPWESLRVRVVGLNRRSI